MIEEYELAIIGLGPTGIGAAWRSLELQVDDFIVLESDTKSRRFIGIVS